MMSLELTEIRALLAETCTLTLATVDPDGTPRATPLFFAIGEGLDLYFLSRPDSQHSRNVLRNPQVAVALYPEVEAWTEIRGLQMKGRIDQLPGEDRQEALACYRRRFGFIARLSEVVMQSAMYRFRPTWVRVIDNRRGFGHHREWHLPPS